MTSTAPARRQNGHSSTPTGIQLPHAAPDRIGQGTAVEQTRAAAEVAASVLAAKQHPRDETRALTRIDESCKRKALAERAFFRYSRSGSQITGPSVHLARELARCWGNIHYGLIELRRDDEYGQSEMQAWAWDLESNARSSSTFVVPHRRDTKNGPTYLTETRDIYENNANNGARRVREAIFAVLPDWVVEGAKDQCRNTLENGEGDKPIAQRRSEMIAWFDRLGVSEPRLAEKLGVPSGRWTGADLATLGVIGRSIKTNETTIAEEFPAEPVTENEITKAQTARKTKAAAQPPAEPEPASPAEQMAEPAAPVDVDLDQLWEQITAMAPRDWTSDRLAQDFHGFTKCTPAEADGPTMQRYLDHLRGQ